MKSFNIPGRKGEISLSGIVLGSTYFGTTTPKELAFDLLDTYYNNGGRTIDTARVYGQADKHSYSKSEKVIGEWIAERGVRDKITLITKGGHPYPEDYPKSHLSRADIEGDMEDSLSTLGVENVDIYFLHRDDENIPVEGIMDTLHDLVEAGKTRAIGASNWSIERIIQANEYAKKSGKTPFAISQIQWSLGVCDNASWGDDTLQFMDDATYEKYLKAAIPVMGFSSQAHGLFHKYITKGKEGLVGKVNRFNNDESIRRAERVKTLCERYNVTPNAVVLAYIYSNALTGCAIIGASNTDQLENSLLHQDFTLTKEEIEFLRKG